MKKLLRTIWRLVQDAMDPVCQDPDAVLLGQYKGYYVRLVPITTNGHIDEWVPNPDDVKRIDRITAEEASAATSNTQTDGTQSSATTMSQPPCTPQQPAFNPAGVPGI